jgi:hypothetical protein
MTFRHRHFKRGKLIETGEVRRRQSWIGRDKKKWAKRMSTPSDARAVLPTAFFLFLGIFAWRETMCSLRLPECEASAEKADG